MRGLVYRRRVISLLRRNRDYRFLTLALLVSLCGDWFATVALAGLILDKTNSDFLASMVFVAASLPAFFMTPFAGPLADRLDRKRIMVVCSGIQAVAACGLLFARDFWVLGIVAQAVVAAIAAFFSPAAQAATANLVAPEDLPTAIAASGSIWGAMLVVGSGLGALVANGWGRQTAFALDALTFVVAAALLSFVRGKTSVDDRSKSSVRAPMRPIDDTREALRYARGNPLVSGFLLAKFGFGLGTGVVGLLAVLAKRRFGNGDKGTGLLLAARGTGVFVGPFIVRVAARRGMGSVVRACGIGSLVYGLAYLAVSGVHSIVLATALVLLAHLGGGVQWAGTFYGLQRSAPDELKGRIMAADFALVTLSMSLSLAVAGIASGTFGPGPVLAVLGVVQIVWAAFYLFRTRSLQRAHGGGDAVRLAS